MIDAIAREEIGASAHALFGIEGVETAANLMALVDHAFLSDQNLIAHWPVGHPEYYNLLGHLSGGEARLSPLLIVLPVTKEDRIRVVTYLLKRCKGHPMLNFLTSSLTSKSLADHLSTLTQIRLPPDSVSYLFRFADTRIVAELNCLLNSAQRTQMFGAVDQWIYLNRRAEWSVIMGGRLSSVPAPGPLALSDEQLTAFLRASLADSLMSTLLNESATFSGMAPSARHQLVSHWISLAEEQHGDAPDPGICLAYCQSQLAYV